MKVFVRFSYLMFCNFLCFLACILFMVTLVVYFVKLTDWFCENYPELAMFSLLLGIVALVLIGLYEAFKGIKEAVKESWNRAKYETFK